MTDLIRTLKKLSVDQRFRNHPKNHGKARKADRKVKTIAGRLVRELERNLEPNSQYQSELEQNKLKKQFNRRAAIEPMIGHLKSDNRMNRNFYKGIKGDAINVMLSAAAFNFKRMMRKWESSFYYFFYYHFILPTRLAVKQLISFFNQVIYSPKEIWVFKG